MNFKALRYTALVGYIAGGGLTAVFGDWHKPSTWALGILSIAGAIKTVLPAQAVVADAPVYSNTGTQDGTNVSTTSTTPIVAPAPPRLDVPPHDPSAP